MRRPVIALATLALLSIAGACSSSDGEENKNDTVVDAGPDPKLAECNEVAYRQAQESCYGGFVADVDPNSRCGGIEGGPAAFEAGAYGETACKARLGGLILKCVFDGMSWCEGKSISQRQELWETCTKQVDPGYKAPEEVCATTCLNKRFACEQACSDEAAKTCFDCYSKCGLDTQTCVDGCARVN